MTRSFGLACLTAALTANILFQILDFATSGHLNKFFLVAFFMGMFYSLGIALIVGIPFWLYRKRHTATIGPSSR
jgi:hypothetical protein